MIKKILFYLVVFSSIIIILGAFLSLIYDLSFWYIKVLDFPRLQYLVGGLICLLSLFLLSDKWTVSTVLLAGFLVGAVSIQLYYIYPYTSFATETVVTAHRNEVDPKSTFSLIIANVWMKNRDAIPFIEIVLKEQPDMVLAMETDQWWMNQLAVLENKYPYRIEQPYNNTYGMALYSKYSIKNSSILYLKHKEVPSFHTEVVLPGKKVFNFYAVHPVPPKPSEYPDNVGESEVELLKIGEMVARESKPSLVAGDFNDVAWSNTSRLFGVKGKLNNVRIGRGLFNSFDATSFILRWPLDHVYVTEEFKLLKIERLPEFGSDHFPILVELSLQ